MGHRFATSGRFALRNKGLYARCNCVPAVFSLFSCLGLWFLLVCSIGCNDLQRERSVFDGASICPKMRNVDFASNVRKKIRKVFLQPRVLFMIIALNSRHFATQHASSFRFKTSGKKECYSFDLESHYLNCLLVFTVDSDVA